jgi:hypothetical protein
MKEAEGAEQVSSEPKGQELIYSARVSLDRAQMQSENKLVNLSPGMAVTMEIKTGSRRIIAHLLSPLLKYAHESPRKVWKGPGLRSDDWRGSRLGVEMVAEPASGAVPRQIALRDQCRTLSRQSIWDRRSSSRRPCAPWPHQSRQAGSRPGAARCSQNRSI